MRPLHIGVLLLSLCLSGCASHGKELMLLAFRTRPLLQDHENAEGLNAAPYTAIAVPVVQSNHVDYLATEDTYLYALNQLNERYDAVVWPWVFINRMIGQREESRHQPQITFRRIKGWDLDDKQGARTAHLDIWRLGLRLAKRSGAPGIMFDMEPYNDYGTYNPGRIAEYAKKTETRVIEQITELGRDMGEIVEEEYPEAVVWFIQCQLETAFSVKYISFGLLDYLKERGLPAIVVDGAGNGSGYVYQSLADMQRRLLSRREVLAPWLSKYPNLRLGGTISPYLDAEKAEGWYKRCIKPDSKIQTIDDFTPLLKTLLSEYDYLWIYAAIRAPYTPHDASLSVEYNRVLEDALKTAPFGRMP